MAKTSDRKPRAEAKSARYKVPPAGNEMEELLAGLARHTDREAAIVGHSLLEAVLEDAIRAHLVANPDSRLFGNGGPLGSFWGLFTLGHAFGVIGDGMRTELQHLNDIRNKFAHGVRGVSFEAPEVAGLCRALRFPDTHAGQTGGGGVALRTREGEEVTWAVFHTAEEREQPKVRFLASVRMCWFFLFAQGFRALPLDHWREVAEGWNAALSAEPPPPSPGTPG